MNINLATLGKKIKLNTECFPIDVTICKFKSINFDKIDVLVYVTDYKECFRDSKERRILTKLKEMRKPLIIVIDKPYDSNGPIMLGDNYHILDSQINTLSVRKTLIPQIIPIFNSASKRLNILDTIAFTESLIPSIDCKEIFLNCARNTIKDKIKQQLLPQPWHSLDQYKSWVQLVNNLVKKFKDSSWLSEHAREIVLEISFNEGTRAHEMFIRVLFDIDISTWSTFVTRSNIFMVEYCICEYVKHNQQQALETLLKLKEQYLNDNQLYVISVNELFAQDYNYRKLLFPFIGKIYYTTVNVNIIDEYRSINPTDLTISETEYLKIISNNVLNG